MQATGTEKLNLNNPRTNLSWGPAASPPQRSAPLFVIQRPLSTDPTQPNAIRLYYILNNIRPHNFPLMPSTSCRRTAPLAFCIRVNNRRFVVTLHTSSSLKHVEGFIGVLQ